MATQSYANTTFGWRGLELLSEGLSPQEALERLLQDDDNPERRQIGIVATDGNSVTYTGDECLAWAGGRNGPNYAIQGNILAGKEVVAAMEKAFLEVPGDLAGRLFATLLVGESRGGDSRGKQSAAMLVVREGAGYGGYTDRAIDIRVDDHPKPLAELGRLLNIAQMNYAWNDAWTLFTRKEYQKALEPMERAAELAPEYGEVHYDLACIRLATGNRAGALAALKKALELNPKLAGQAQNDEDLKGLHDDPEFQMMIQTGEK